VLFALITITGSWPAGLAGAVLALTSVLLVQPPLVQA
jgi:hypothetical protein